MIGGRKLFLLSIAVIGWIAIGAQLVLQLKVPGADTSELLIRFFSYYTILTNILVAVFATTQLLASENKQQGFLFGPAMETAIALHITIVGFIYNLLLRGLWTEGGLQAVLNDVLHTLIPIMVLVYWWSFTNARNLRYGQVFTWLIYPAVYFIFIGLRGAASGWYPYPFLNVSAIGYPEALTNCLYVAIAFLLFSLILVWIGKIKRVPH